MPQPSSRDEDIARCAHPRRDAQRDGRLWRPADSPHRSVSAKLDADHRHLVGPFATVAEARQQRRDHPSGPSRREADRIVSHRRTSAQRLGTGSRPGRAFFRRTLLGGAR